MGEAPDKVDINETADAIFEEKSGNRLVWIVPSIILHLVVFGLWFIVPEKQRKKIQTRKMVIKSDQAEQLKQFVEDSNLRELRAEVRRLQEIKQAMASIRTVDMNTLRDFEGAMRSSLDAEMLRGLADLQECHKSFAASQAEVMQKVQVVASLFESLQPLMDRKDVAAIVPCAERIIQARKELYTSLEKMNEVFLQLPAKQDSADSIFSWIKDADTRRMWGKFVDLQEQMFALQSKCYEEQSDFPYKQDWSLSRIIAEGPEFEPKLQKSKDDEKKAWLDYETRKVNYTGEVESNTAAVKELENTVRELSAKLQQIKDEKDRLNKERAAVSSKSSDGKKQRDQLQNRIKEQEKSYAITGNEKKSVERKLNDAKKRISRAEYELKRLKEPSDRWIKDRERSTERMYKYFDALSAKAGDVEGLKEACRLQQETLQVIQALVERVKQGTEAVK